MKTTLVLLLIQGCLGAFDTLWYHEFKSRLPQSLSAKKELRLHAYRDFIYAAMFGLLAWATYNGWYAWVLCALLGAEIAITLADFVEEDRSRKVPAGERVMHTVMGIVYGAFLTSLVPQIAGWLLLPSRFVPGHYGTLSWVMTAFAGGVLLSGLRDLLAASRGSWLNVPVKAKGV